MQRYIKEKDSLSRLINKSAQELYLLLKNLDVDRLGMPANCLEYFKGSHFKRLHFSIETSAQLLYRSISMTGKDPADCTIMDYGAGVGTLYTLAKMIGCKTVIYNDHLKEWQLSAELIAKAIGVSVDHYVVGDIEDTLQYANRNSITLDIITSRNVIEHIYRLDEFYLTVARLQPKTLIYSSTTANYRNPGSRIQHYLWHKKWEKVYAKERREIIQSAGNGLSESLINELTAATRGLSRKDILGYLEQFRLHTQKPDRQVIGSNTCEPETGVWAENMLPYKQHRIFIESAGFICRIEPGFWDTNYRQYWKNLLGLLLNSVSSVSKNLGFLTTPFIYVIALPEINKPKRPSK